MGENDERLDTESLARKHAEITHDEDWASIRAYVAQGISGNTNADVLARLLIGMAVETEELREERASQDAVIEALRGQVEKLTERLKVVEISLDERDKVIERVGQSLENVVAPKLYELRQLPDRVADIERRLRSIEQGVTGLGS